MNVECPVCLENEAIYFTECNHRFCITCLSRIKKCAMCRKVLLRSKICSLIKAKISLISISNPEIVTTNSISASLEVDYIYLDTNERRRFQQHPHEYLLTRLNFNSNDRFSQREGSYFNQVVPLENNSTNGINMYSFAIQNPEEWQPSGTSPFS